MTKKTNDGKRGGNLVGKPHNDKNGNPVGGIKAVVSDAGGKPVELEGGEVIINKEASKKHWRELSRINQSAGNGVPINEPIDPHDHDPEDSYKDGGKIEFNANEVPNRWILSYAEKIRTKHPEIWDLGGNIFGNEAYKNLKRVAERGYWLDSEEWMYKKWRSFVARHKQDFRIAGVIAMLKWADKVDRGWSYMKDLIEAEIKKREDKKGFGGILGKAKDKIKSKAKETKRNIALDVIYDTKDKVKAKKDINSLRAASELVENKYSQGGGVVTYKNKFNKKYGFEPNESHSLAEIAKLTKLKLSALQDIYDKGIGAYKTNPQSVRPNVKSKEQWAMARVYSAVMGGKAAKVDANELERGKKYAKGGLIAPNGKQSNLTPEQYKLVRTKAFKDWFGDWENDPKNASKVVDENGEPLVVYRGMPKKRRVGNVFKYNVNLFGTKGVGGRQTNKFAFYFADKKEVAENYGENLSDDDGGYIVKPYFLNIRNLFEAFSKKNQHEIKFKELYDLANKTGKPIYLKNYKGEVETNSKGNPIQWKDQSSEWVNKYEHGDINSTFSYFADWSNKQGNQWFWRVYLETYLNYNGLVFYEVSQNADYDEVGNSIKPKYGDEYSKTYAVFKPTQIKLADGSNTTFNGSNPDIRFADGGEVYHLGGGMSKRLAPNGKPSNLTHEQWHLVRTPEFKAWFGDWENSPETASKVVDENGEPLVVYHATKNEFTVFEVGKNTIGTFGKGIYFANSKGYVSVYNRGEKQRILSVFLNITNPIIINNNEMPIGYERYSPERMNENKGISRDFTLKAKAENFNGVVASVGYKDIEYVVFEPNQIKLADGSNTTFDGSNPDIRYEQGGGLEFYERTYADGTKQKFTIKEYSDIVKNRELGKGMGGEVYHLVSKHLAPNGKPSNLTHEQWHLVRTPEFKAWFGDWEKLAYAKVKDAAMDEITLENLSKDISKVVDENGEPLVVYRGFNSKSDKGNVFGYGVNRFKHNRKANRFAHYFTKSKIVAHKYAEQGEKKNDTDIIVKAYFLNAKKPLDLTIKNPKYPKFDEWVKVRDSIFENSDYKLIEQLEKRQIPLHSYLFSSVISSNNENDLDELSRLKIKELNDKIQSQASEQMERYKSSEDIDLVNLVSLIGKTSLDDLLGSEYNSNEASSRRKVYEWFINQKSSDTLVVEDLDMILRNFILKNKYDGGVFKEWQFGIKTETDKEVYFVFESNQIKLADGSNTTFNGSNPDIRYDNGGVIYSAKQKVLSGEINSDDAAILIDENGFEVTDELYDELREAENIFRNKGRGLQVGDLVIVRGKHGLDNFEGNYRGTMPDGKLIVWTKSGSQIAISKDEIINSVSDKYSAGGEVKLNTYQQRINANLEQMGTPSSEWSAVPISGFADTDADGKIVTMPQFSFPQGYVKAPTLFPNNQSGNMNCELCGRMPIKNAFYIQNDKKKFTLLVGSECVTHFGEGASGKQNERSFKVARAIILDNDMIMLKRFLNDNFKTIVDIGYGRKNAKWKTFYTPSDETRDYFAEISKLKTLGVFDVLYDTKKANKYDNNDTIYTYYIHSIVPTFGYESIKKGGYGWSDEKIEKDLLTWYSRNEKLAISIYTAVEKLCKAFQIDFDENQYIYFKQYLDSNKMEFGGELAKGIKTEMEHSATINNFKRSNVSTEQVATAIAKDHLKENKKYYSRLSDVERKMKQGGNTFVARMDTPDGEQTRLTYFQQNIVRTKAFKDFFGDWETAAKNFIADGYRNFDVHYANVSKVINLQTLEPIVLFHGTNTDKEFYDFDVATEKQMGRPYAYFSYEEKYAENFMQYSQRNQAGVPLKYKAFINVRKPLYAVGEKFELKRENEDYWFDVVTDRMIFDILGNSPNQQKVDDYKNVFRTQIYGFLQRVFSGNKLPFWTAMARDTKSVFKRFLMTYKYDGIIYHEEISSIFDESDPSQYTKAVTVFNANDIKLADGRNLTFDPMKSDVRYADGGNINTTSVEVKPVSEIDALGKQLFGNQYVEKIGMFDGEEVEISEPAKQNHNNLFVQNLINKLKK